MPASWLAVPNRKRTDIGTLDVWTQDGRNSSPTGAPWVSLSWAPTPGSHWPSMKGLSARLHPLFEAIKRVNKQTLQQLQTNPKTRALRLCCPLARQKPQAIVCLLARIVSGQKSAKRGDRDQDEPSKENKNVQRNKIRIASWWGGAKSIGKKVRRI